jgi:hypothetical protein
MNTDTLESENIDSKISEKKCTDENFTQQKSNMTLETSET